MFMIVQIPFADLRPIIAGGRGPLERPDWAANKPKGLLTLPEIETIAPSTATRAPKTAATATAATIKDSSLHAYINRLFHARPNDDVVRLFEIFAEPLEFGWFVPFEGQSFKFGCKLLDLARISFGESLQSLLDFSVLVSPLASFECGHGAREEACSKESRARSIAG